MRSIILTSVLLVAAVAGAQEKIKGNGNMTQKTVSTPAYDQVNVSGFFDVNLIAGSEGKITIEGESNIVEFIECKVDGNSLTICVEKGKRISPSAGKSITVTVPFESLNEVTLAGSGDVTSKSTIKATDFTTTLSGSGDIKLHVDAQQVNAKVTGSGNMTLKGNSGDLTCSVTGSGDLDAFGLDSNNADATVTGSGNCKVNCSGFLQAKVTGSGDIDYKGDPKKKDTKVHGSGAISKA
ncbi:MAG TPA: head GIN domain-containing protein [Flavobacterium sp.]|jgi:hypothetical protein|nr:head GIN domain-containing protein [Flavobacterium sp.]